MDQTQSSKINQIVQSNSVENMASTAGNRATPKVQNNGVGMQQQDHFSQQKQSFNTQSS